MIEPFTNENARMVRMVHTMVIYIYSKVCRAIYKLDHIQRHPISVFICTNMRGSEANQNHCPLGGMVQVILKGWVEMTSSTTHCMKMHIARAHVYVWDLTLH